MKELFGDSDTVMAVISGVPSRELGQEPAAARSDGGDAEATSTTWPARSAVLSHGLLRPNLGTKEFDEMERQVKELKIDAWKMYTGAELGEKAWFLDDEKVAYPFWEQTQEAGHQEPLRPQGSAAGLLQREGLHAARPGKGGEGLARSEFHRLPFRLSRHGLAGPRHRRAVVDQKDRRSAGDSLDQRHFPHPEEEPEDQQHLLRAGQHLRQLSRRPHNMPAHAGPDDPDRGRRSHLWGTDSIWGGSPQSQIVALRRLRCRQS